MLIKKIQSFGTDLKTVPAANYISLLRSERKFAVVQVTKDRMYIGLKIKDQLPTERLATSPQ